MFKAKSRRAEYDLSDVRVMTRELTEDLKKQKVFYFGHPDDASKYFDKISNDILDAVNCMVYYADDLDNERLEEMNLFVAAVTKRFTDDNGNPYINRFLNFAKSKGIFLIPIMVEPGLESAFNKFSREYENIQLLDITSRDSTQISYKEKLKKLLASEELEEEIKNVFKSHLFLSYRKKDRIHAQELMKVIHNNKSYRDIAIWYDEFLVPGEVFTDSIWEKMDDCKVFLLAVTPNVLEEREENGRLVPNFVMGEEYPKAVRLGKPIFPAELVPTDREELKEKFNGLPECVNINDSEAFAARLAAVLDGIACRGDRSPEHDYLIGNAYLYGIEVEKNREIAFEHILSSAERGYVPAMEKLKFMYFGEFNGVRDLNEVVKWARRLVEVYEDKLDSGSEEDIYNWCYNQGIITDMLSIESKFDKVMEITPAIINMAKKAIVKYDGSDKIKYILSHAYHTAAKCCMNTTDKRKALEYYNKAFETITSMETLSPRNIGDAVCDLAEIAELLFYEERYDEAIEYGLKAIEFREEHEAIDEEADVYLGTAYCFIGLSYISLNKNEEAEKYLKEGAECAERAYNASKYESAMATAVRCLLSLANFYEAVSEPEKAEKAYFKMFYFSKELSDSFPDTTTKNIFAEYGKKYAEFLEKIGKEHEAYGVCFTVLAGIRFEASLMSDNLLEAEFNVMACRLGLSIGALTSAMHFSAAEEAMMRIYDKVDSDIEKIRLAFILLDIGECAKEINKNKAIVCYKAAANIFMQQYKENSIIFWRKKAAISLYELGYLYMYYKKDADLAEEYFEEAAHLYVEIMAAGEETLPELHVHIRAYEELAIIYMDREQYSRAARYFRECIESRLENIDEFNKINRVGNLGRLVWDYTKLGGIYFFEKKYNETIFLYKKAYKYCKELISEAPTQENINMYNSIIKDLQMLSGY